MTEKELISKLQELKQIKPNQEWAFLLKNEILGSNVLNKQVASDFSYQGILSGFFNLFLEKKLAYVVAAFLFVVSGLFGFVNVLPGNEVVKVAEQSPAAIVSIKSVVKSLTDAIQKNPKIAKDVALELKNNGTLASLNSRADLQETSGILYEAIVKQMIKDLEKSTLNENQRDMFNDVKNLYDDGKYSDALEKILSEF